MSKLRDIKKMKTIKSFNEVGEIILDDVKRYEEGLNSRPKLHSCSVCNEKIGYGLEGRMRDNKLGLYFCDSCYDNKAKVVSDMIGSKIKELNE